MRKIMILALLLAGCASPQERQAKQAEIDRTIPVCTGDADCRAKWERAQVWIAQNSNLRLQIATDVLLETYNSNDMSLAVRIVKEPLGGGMYRILAAMSCMNIFACDTDPYDAIIDFNRQVSAARP